MSVHQNLQMARETKRAIPVSGACFGWNVQTGSTVPCILPTGTAPSRAGAYLTARPPALDAFHLAHQGQVEARAKAVLQEERGARAAEPPLGNDGDAVPKEVGLVHVVSGHDDGSACKGGAGVTGQAKLGLAREGDQQLLHYMGPKLRLNK